MHRICLVVLLAVSGAVAAHKEALDHSGPVRIGHDFSGLADKAVWEPNSYADGQAVPACEIYEGGLLSDGISMMVEDGHVTRFQVYDAGRIGPFGLLVGDSEESAMTKVPRGTTIELHHYAGEHGHYLTWRDPGSDLAIRVETIDGTVEGFYWGRWESVQYVEGCL